MRHEPHRWILTTDAMYWNMRDVLPPQDSGGGGFIVGEPNHHNADGEAVYACFHQINNEVVARYMTQREFSTFKSFRNRNRAP